MAERCCSCRSEHLPGRADSDNARYGNVNSAEANVNWIERDNDNQNVRFRPAVVFVATKQPEYFTGVTLSGRLISDLFNNMVSKL